MGHEVNTRLRALGTLAGTQEVLRAGDRMGMGVSGSRSQLIHNAG